MKRIAGLTIFLAGTLLLLPIFSDAEATGFGPLYWERLETGRALIEVQAANWPSVVPYYTEDIEYHDPIVDIYGLDMMAEFLGRLFGSSPDLVTTIEDETLVGNVYTATWTMVGRFSDVPYSAKGISIIKFARRSAQVYYQRDYYSENDIMINIPGLDEAVVGFRTFYRCAVDPTFECPLKDAAHDVLTAIEPPTAVLETEPNPNRDYFPSWLDRQQKEIGRALVEINGADWQSLLQHYADDIEYYDPIVAISGIETMTAFLGRLFGNSPDLITTVEDESLINGVYTATWTMAGQFGEVPFSAKGMSIVKFRRGSTQVFYSRDYYTEGDIMINIPGLDEAVGGFRTFYRCAVDPTFECPLEDPQDLSAGFGEDGQTRSDTPRAVSSFGLQQNVPNPFNPTTEISFVVPDGGANVSLRIYDVTGRLVRTLIDGFEPAGARAVSWLGKDDQGRPLASGVYYYQLTGPEFAEQRRMVLLK